MKYFNFILWFFFSMISLNANDSELKELRLLLGERIEINKMNDKISEDVKKIIKKDKLIKFLEIKNKYYTLNLGTTTSISSAKKFIQDRRLDIKNSYLYEFGPKMSSVKILYGIYSSVYEAQIAINELGDMIKKDKPYVDNISKHQALYFKYH